MLDTLQSLRIDPAGKFLGPISPTHLHLFFTVGCTRFENFVHSKKLALSHGVKNSSDFGDSHCKFVFASLALTSATPVQVLKHPGGVVFIHFLRGHLDAAAVVATVVAFHQILKDVQVSQRIFGGKISPHSSF